MKIFLGGLHMEANSFSPAKAGCAAFTTWLEGEALETMRGTSLELGGAYARFDQEEDLTLLPGFFAQACASGPVRAEDFARMSEKLFASAQEAGEVDGALLVLHGAMQSETLDDCEGYLLTRLRQIFGERAFLCASFDLHAMMTEEMMAALDGCAGYHTYPHVDHYDTGYRAADHLLSLLRSPQRPRKFLRRIPMIMSCENSNTIDSPMVREVERLKALLAREEVLSGSLFLTQPWLDAPDLGCSAALFLREDAGREADAEAQAILDHIWSNRRAFYPPMPDIHEALERCRSLPRPVCLVDYGDVPNAGSTGDGTVVLRALLEAELDCSSVVVVADRESALRAAALGVGAQADFSIGGTGAAGAFNQRLSVTAQVLAVNDQPFVHLGPAQRGFVSRPGLRSLLRCGSVYIILCERVCISHDRNMLLTMGLDPADMGIIAMRATHSFMSCYEGVMGSWLYADTPGCSARNLKSLPYRRCRRPIYPLDDFDAAEGERSACHAEEQGPV